MKKREMQERTLRSDPKIHLDSTSVCVDVLVSVHVDEAPVDMISVRVAGHSNFIQEA